MKTLEIRGKTPRLVQKTGLSPPVKYFTDHSKAYFCGSFMGFFLSFVCYTFVRVCYLCLVVTCWERADLLALVCGVFPRLSLIFSVFINIHEYYN